MTAAVSFSGISKRFIIDRNKSHTFQEVMVNMLRRKSDREQFWALRDVSFDVAVGNTVGIIGNNGSGKSTALKLISGIIRPTSGSLAVNGRVSALLELGAGFHPDLTGRENIFLAGTILGMRQKEMKRRFDEIVDFSELAQFIDMPVKHYSSGMYMRLAFAVATSVEPDILLVDEVLAVGDSSFQKKCFDRIRSFQRAGKTIIFVSHDLASVTETSSTVIWLHKGSVRQIGPSNQVVADYLEFTSAHGRSLAEETPTAADLTSDRPVRITKVDVLGTDGTPRFVFRTGEELVVSIGYIASDSAPRVGFGVTVARSDGTYCYATNTQSDIVTGVALKEEGAVRLSFKPLTLLPGTFFIHATIFERRSHTHYDFREHAAMFKVHSDLSDHGVCILPHEWQTEERSAPGPHPTYEPDWQEQGDKETG
jgi:lipopolysaccharide transport system ATP-binding protein